MLFLCLKLLIVPKSPIIARRHLEKKSSIGPPLAQPQQPEFWLASLRWAIAPTFAKSTDHPINSHVCRTLG